MLERQRESWKQKQRMRLLINADAAAVDVDGYDYCFEECLQQIDALPLYFRSKLEELENGVNYNPLDVSFGQVPPGSENHSKD